MRALVVLALAGCFNFEASPQAKTDGFGGGSGSGGALAACQRDSDCVTAGPKCCDCPTTAVNKTDPLHQACIDVVCPPMVCPDSVSAVCDQGQCVLACAPMACQTTCPDGYAFDNNGCLTCDCALVNSRSCGVDGDCAETRADCCGCLRGGTDTAVLASEVTAFDASLNCPPDPYCPAMDACVAGVGPHCIEGACALAAATPAGACGRSDLPACLAGQACTVNANADATAHGVGVCM